MKNTKFLYGGLVLGILFALSATSWAGYVNGHSCSFNNDCSSKSCINGYCCNSGQCGYAGKCYSKGKGYDSAHVCYGTGDWRRTNGQQCSFNNDCGSNYCVNGNCCNSGQCGYAGKCYSKGKGYDSAHVCKGNGDWRKTDGQQCSFNSDCYTNLCSRGICGGKTCAQVCGEKGYITMGCRGTCLFSQGELCMGSTKDCGSQCCCKKPTTTTTTTTTTRHTTTTTTTIKPTTTTTTTTKHTTTTTTTTTTMIKPTTTTTTTMPSTTTTTIPEAPEFGSGSVLMVILLLAPGFAYLAVRKKEA